MNNKIKRNFTPTSTRTLSKEEYEKFLEEKSKSLQKKIIQDIDIYKRLKDK